MPTYIYIYIYTYTVYVYVYIYTWRTRILRTWVIERMDPISVSGECLSHEVYMTLEKLSKQSANWLAMHSFHFHWPGRENCSCIIKIILERGKEMSSSTKLKALRRVWLMARQKETPAVQLEILLCPPFVNFLWRRHVALLLRYPSNMFFGFFLWSSKRLQKTVNRFVCVGFYKQTA